MISKDIYKYYYNKKKRRVVMMRGGDEISHGLIHIYLFGILLIKYCYHNDTPCFGSSIIVVGLVGLFWRNDIAT